MKALILLCLVYLFAIQLCCGEDGEVTLDSFKSKSIKELKKILADKGMECKGCSEKSDYVHMAYSARDVADVTQQAKQEDPVPPATESASTPSPPVAGEDFVSDPETVSATPPPNDDELAEIMERLKSNRFGSPKVFRPEDFANLSQEEIAEKLKNFNGKGGKKKSGSSKKDSKKEKKEKKTDKKEKKEKKEKADEKSDDAKPDDAQADGSSKKESSSKKNSKKNKDKQKESKKESKKEERKFESSSHSHNAHAHSHVEDNGESETIEL
eukprot:gene31393-37946_t